MHNKENNLSYKSQEKFSYPQSLQHNTTPKLIPYKMALLSKYNKYEYCIGTYCKGSEHLSQCYICSSQLAVVIKSKSDVNFQIFFLALPVTLKSQKIISIWCFRTLFFLPSEHLSSIFSRTANQFSFQGLLGLRNPTFYPLAHVYYQ